MFSVQLHFYDTEKEKKKKKKKKKPQITIAVSDRWYGVVERCRADDKRTRKRERDPHKGNRFFLHTLMFHSLILYCKVQTQ